MRFSIYWILFSFTLLFIGTSCNSDPSEYSKLERYYTRNIALHNSLFDSLSHFCKINQTDVILRKSNFRESAIAFRIHFYVENAFVPVFYDTAFIRRDPYPDKTLKYAIPFNIIKGFSESRYSAVSADSNQTFFGDRWDVNLLPGTQSDSQYGILISSDTKMLNSCVKKLSPTACLTKGTIQ